MKLLILTLISLPLAAAACRDDGPCLLYLLPSIEVLVHDSVTGAGAASGARLVVRDGSYSDSVDNPVLPQFSEGFIWDQDRAGTYTVIVGKAGYKDWFQLNVRVLKDGCHGRPVTLAARLQSI